MENKPRPGSIYLLLWTVYILLTDVLVTGDEKTKLITDPKNILVIERGDSGEITCKYETEPQNPETLVWLFHNGTVVNNLNIPGIKAYNETLKFTNATDIVTGKYNCTTVSRTMWVEAEVRVYVMPTYFVEGMVIVGINGVLILIFIGCGIGKCIRERQENRKLKQKNRRKL